MTNRHNRDVLGYLIAILILIVVCMVTLTVILATSAKAAQCPDGHSIAAERPAPYYVYTPNLPAGYSAVWVDDVVTLLPPPGSYGVEGQTVTVCYTDDIYAFAATIPTTTTTLGQSDITPPTADTQTCEEGGSPGIVMYDGTCMTIDRYNDTFSDEHLATVPSHTDPGRSVAEVTSRSPSDNTPPADRTRTLNGVEHISFTRLVGNHLAL